MCFILSQGDKNRYAFNDISESKPITSVKNYLAFVVIKLQNTFQEYVFPHFDLLNVCDKTISMIKRYSSAHFIVKGLLRVIIAS